MQIGEIIEDLESNHSSSRSEFDRYMRNLEEQYERAFMILGNSDEWTFLGQI